jgi:acyl-coenzyme A thioesterase PaaI-like protein
MLIDWREMTSSELTADLRNLVRSPQNRCFACGPGNDCGMKLQFDEVGAEVMATFVPRSAHSGWTGVVHGGILATALDEAMAYVLYFSGIKGLTARMEVRYRHPALQGEELKVVARKVSEARRIVDIEAQLLKEHTLVAEASGRFMKMGALTLMDLLPGAQADSTGEEST